MGKKPFLSTYKGIAHQRPIPALMLFLAFFFILLPATDGTGNPAAFRYFSRDEIDRLVIKKESFIYRQLSLRPIDPEEAKKQKIDPFFLDDIDKYYSMRNIAKFYIPDCSFRRAAAAYQSFSKFIRRNDVVASSRLVVKDKKFVRVEDGYSDKANSKPGGLSGTYYYFLRTQRKVWAFTSYVNMYMRSQYSFNKKARTLVCRETNVTENKYFKPGSLRVRRILIPYQGGVLVYQTIKTVTKMINMEFGAFEGIKNKQLKSVPAETLQQVNVIKGIVRELSGK